MYNKLEGRQKNNQSCQRLLGNKFLQVSRVKRIDM